MVNLLQVNTQTFQELTTYLKMLWSAPLQIIVSVALLWQYLGVASLAGLVTMILFIPMNVYLSSKAKVLQTKKMKLQDTNYGWKQQLQLQNWTISYTVKVI